MTKNTHLVRRFTENATISETVKLKRLALIFKKDQCSTYLDLDI